MRDTQGRNAPQVDAVNTYVKEHGVDLRTVELDVQSQESCRRGDRADRRRVEERGRWRQPDEGAGGAVRIIVPLRPYPHPHPSPGGRGAQRRGTRRRCGPSTFKVEPFSLREKVAAAG